MWNDFAYQYELWCGMSSQFAPRIEFEFYTSINWKITEIIWILYSTTINWKITEIYDLNEQLTLGSKF